MSKESKTEGISSFQKYLSVWVLLCMAVGILIGKFLPAAPTFLDKLSIAGISIPIAILIWVMIYPMMMKVDFQSVKHLVQQWYLCGVPLQKEIQHIRLYR